MRHRQLKGYTSRVAGIWSKEDRPEGEKGIPQRKAKVAFKGWLSQYRLGEERYREQSIIKFTI